MMANWKQLNDPALGGYAKVFGNHGNNLFVLLGEDFEKPAGGACERKHSAKDTYRRARDEPRKYQGCPTCQDKWPRCRGWQFHLARGSRGFIYLFCCYQGCHFFSSAPEN